MENKIEKEVFPGNNVSQYDKVKTDEYFPAHLEDLKSLLSLAKSLQKSIYPISTGRNWGLGSKLPCSSNSLIVNLSKMNKVIEFDKEHGHIVLEPGVTQDDLYQFLKELKVEDYFFDVTGSSKDSSVVGNSLERGISYHGLRAESVMGLEVLTGEGKLIRTGNWRFSNSKTKLSYPHGIGANLTPLFFQSNFGIITKMALKLKRKRKYTYTIKLGLKNIENLSSSLLSYKKLFEAGVIDSIFHIANKERAKEAMNSYAQYKIRKIGGREVDASAEKFLNKVLSHPWSAIGEISDDDKMIAQRKVKLLRKEMKNFAHVIAISDFHMNILDKFATYFEKLGIAKQLLITKPFRDLSKGVPTDAALGCILGNESFLPNENLSEKIDSVDQGFLYCLPLTGLNKNDCLSMVSIIEEVALQFKLKPSITLNPLSPFVLEAVVSISFSPSDAHNAKECIRYMHKQLIEAGHYPYRTNIHDMDLFEECFSKSDYQTSLVKIKKALDPENLISPGRYMKKDINK